MVDLMLQEQTYAWRSIWSESGLLPDAAVHVEEAGEQHEEPHDEVDAVEDVVEDDGVFHTGSQHDGHSQADEAAEEVGIRLSWKQGGIGSVWPSLKRDDWLKAMYYVNTRNKSFVSQIKLTIR